jgi:hypothetical protein
MIFQINQINRVEIMRQINCCLVEAKYEEFFVAMWQYK